MANAFSLDMGFHDDTASEDEGHPDTISRARSQITNSEKPTRTGRIF